MTETAELNCLRWKCRRGMKELDTVLLRYLDQYFEQASDLERQAFLALLDMQDPELYFLLLGKTTSNNKDITSVITNLQSAPRD